MVLLLMLGFAGAGSSAVVTRALAQPKPLSPVQQEKRLGPKPTPHWYWRWVQWRLGEGYAKGHPLQPNLRPRAPHHVPVWAWQRLHYFLLARSQRTLAAQGGQTRKKGHGPPPTTTTGTTATTGTTSTTSTTGTTSTTDTTGTTSTTPSGGGGTYEQAISYTQTRPAFTATRTIDVSNASQLQSALSNLQPGDLVRATTSFTVSGETVIKNRLSAPAELDLTGVSFVYSGGLHLPAVWLDNAQNLYIYGGDMTTDGTGGGGILDYGSQHVLWWGFYVHDTGAGGVGIMPVNGPVDHDDFQGEITRVGQNLAWDPHVEKGTGLHAVLMDDVSNSNAFTNNRFAFYAHDIPTGACVQAGNNTLPTAAGGNVLYLKCVNETEDATTQTGGNAIQFWGYTNNLGLDIKYLEGDNLQGYALWGGGLYSGQALKGVTVEYGRASNTNLNPRYAGQNPWDPVVSVAYQDVAPTP